MSESDAAGSFVPPDVDQNSDARANIEWNRQRWGQRAGWQEHDSFGYRWSGRFQHSVAGIAKVFDRYLRPFTAGRYDLTILEISPGAGRSTAELLRYAQHLTAIDLNPVAIEICRDRFRHIPRDVEFIVNDGASLSAVSGKAFDLVASYDSLVHVHPDVVKGYLEQAAELLVPGGLVWLDTSGKGQRDKGRRTGVTSTLMSKWSSEAGLEVVDQIFRNDWDCITVARAPS